MDTQNFQNLQEISKKLLGSYVSKAGEDLRRNKNKEFLRRGDAEYHDSGSRRSGPNPELAAQARADAKTYSDKASRRARGLAMAGKKIANESTLEEYVNNVVKSILEDVFDSSQSSAASRQNVKKAKKTLGASSPHTKELAKLHTKMKNSRFVYGIADSELDRRAADPEFQGSKPTLTPMKGKAWSGYDAIGGTSDRSVNTGVIKKAAAAIKKGRGGKVVSEGAVEKIKEKIKGMLGKNPKNPKAKKEQKPGLMSSLGRAMKSPLHGIFEI